MLRIRNVLTPFDFSESSAGALKLAAALADDYGARLTLLHVAAAPPVGMIGEIPVAMSANESAEMRRRLREIEVEPAAVAVDRVLVEGDPATEILAAAERIGADLIVLGTHGRTGISRLLMGSVAENVVRRATVPVMLAKAPRPHSRSARPTESEADALETATVSV